ncbi:MAG: hypothetical protein IPM79_25160 [Polyangiaceae bacterium]|nr:hypothetical protein [Polyangiaceae bacterium]
MTTNSFLPMKGFGSACWITFHGLPQPVRKSPRHSSVNMKNRRIIT